MKFILNVVIVVLMAGLLLTPTRAEAEPITIAAFFAGLRDTLQQAITDARNAGDAVAIQAGRQALIAVAEAEAVYANSMNKSFDRLDKTARENLQALKTSVDQVAAKTIPAAQQFTAHLESIVQQLPFRSHEPKVRDVFPHFVALKAGAVTEGVQIRVVGAFDNIGRKEYAPKLIVGTKSFNAEKAASGQISFLVPASLLRADVRDDKYSFARATLIVPWEQSCGLANLLSCRVENSYPLLVGLLPASPGEISIEFKVKEPRTKRVHYVGVNHHTSSQKEAGNNDQDVRYSDNAAPGCSIDVETVQFKGGGHGQTTCNLEAKDSKSVLTHHVTIHKSIGSSGVCDTWIEFEQVCPVPDEVVTMPKKEVNSSKTTQLRWGDRKVFDMPENLASWKVTFKSFDGRELEFSNPGSDSRNQLGVGVEGGSLSLSAADEYSLEVL